MEFDAPEPFSRIYRKPDHVLFFERVAEVGFCWCWTGIINSTGYGELSYPGNRRVLAHRVSHELFIGPIPEGYQVDHLCRNRWCVNPAHLEAVTQAENIRRQPNVLAKMAQTHCKWGHEFTPENTNTSRGKRECKACHSRKFRASLIDLPQVVCAYCQKDLHHLARHDRDDCACANPRCRDYPDQDDEERERRAAAGYFDPIAIEGDDYAFVAEAAPEAWGARRVDA